MLRRKEKPRHQRGDDPVLIERDKVGLFAKVRGGGSQRRPSKMLIIAPMFKTLLSGSDRS